MLTTAGLAFSAGDHDRAAAANVLGVYRRYEG